KDGDFMAGRYELTQDGTKPLAAVVNRGTIRTAPGGKAALIAPVVSNEGTIEAPGGGAALAAGTAAGGDLDGRGPGNLRTRGPARGQKGGLVHVAGRVTGVRNGGRLDASGDAGGGTVIAGNDPLVTAPQQAVSHVVVEDGALLSADATRAGRGGRVAAKSDR